MTTKKIISRVMRSEYVSSHLSMPALPSGSGCFFLDNYSSSSDSCAPALLFGFKKAVSLSRINTGL
ncbi:MAG: hypothetical protein A4E54_01188 [Pelotomaculum sp. PtaB.Bin117]|nr:MAG: hypothetical protein A4E54_01188 [Pelotomaculum sp. PtaB.Bin117]